MKSAQLRALLIAGTVLISVAIYFAPGQINKDRGTAKEVIESTQGGLQADDLLRSAKASLDTTQRKNLEFFEEAIRRTGKRTLRRSTESAGSGIGTGYRQLRRYGSKGRRRLSRVSNHISMLLTAISTDSGWPTILQFVRNS